MNPKPTIHLISGLGADRHSFSRLTLNDDFSKNYIDWFKPMKNESIQDYSLRLIRNYNISDGDIIIGLSFGGMIAVEMNKHIKPKLTILISSVLSRKEFPVGFQIVGRLKLNRYLTKDKLSRPNPVNYFVFGAETEEQRSRLDQILMNIDPDFTFWAIEKMLSWENNTVPDNLKKIHGKKDRIFPIKKTSADHIVKGGSHLMVFDHAKEISGIINQYLEKIT